MIRNSVPVFEKKLKRSVSLALVILVFLNTMGYYLVFLGIEYRNDIRMLRLLDTSDYNPSVPITVKIPIAVPYLSDETEFTRVDGKYEHRGEYYRMVKQRYAQDTLYIICIKDNENKRIRGAMSDYVRTFAHNPIDPQSSAKLILSFNKDYIQPHIELKTSTAGWVADIIKASFYGNLVSTYSSSIIHPPERG